MLKLVLWYLGLISHEVNLQHVAIIMDGNRRWTKRWYRRIQGSIPTLVGHQQGANNAEIVVRTCHTHRVKFVTLYAFSTENWSRSEHEVDYLFDLFRKHFSESFRRLIAENVRIQFIGRRDRLPGDIVEQMSELECDSGDNTGIVLTIAMDYGGVDEHERALLALAEHVRAGDVGVADVATAYDAYLDTHQLPEVDLLIRTSGEQRLSNFLPQRLSYAELYFTSVCWPDFGRWQTMKALYRFSSRVRTKGGDRLKKVPAPAGSKT